MNTPIQILACIGIGATFSVASYCLGSTFISNFVDSTLITILVSIWAIDSATASILLTKMRDVIEHLEADTTNEEQIFKGTAKELKKSMVEQFRLVIIAFVLLVIKSSKNISPSTDHHLALFTGVLDALLIACFAFSIYALFDLSKSIFIILRTEED